MKVLFHLTALALPLLAAQALADPDKNESGRHARGRAVHHAHADQESWKRQEELAREERKRWEEAERERRKREKEWLREEQKRAAEWHREHGHHGYVIYEPYPVYPAESTYPPEGIVITREGIDIWLRL